MKSAPLLQSETVLQPLGRALLTSLYATAQALRIYPVENATVQNTLEELQQILQRIVDREGVVALRLIGDFVFLNDARLRLDLSDYVAFGHVAGLFNRHGIGEVRIEAEFSRHDLVPFLTLLLQEGAGDENAFTRFNGRLRASPADYIVVEPPRAVEIEEAEEDDHAKEAAKLTYFQSTQVVKEVLTDSRLGKAVNIRRVKRAVQSIVDQVLHNETSILGMTTLRDYDEYTFTHSVNVCIFSVVIGQKLGLSRLQLYELGLGALFHDIGKMRIRPEVVNKPGPLTEEEFTELQHHPTEGLLALFSLRGLTEVPYRAMLMAYEHHMKVDLTGYPRNQRPRQPTLFSRVVAVADGFDAGTSKRSYQHQPWPPDEVMREMRDNPRRGYDALLVKAFINVTGVFPVGTLVILDTHEMAVVMARNPEGAHIHQPIVKIISDPLGVVLPEPVTADLSELDPDTGRSRRSIIKTTDPDKYGINVGDYFV